MMEAIFFTVFLVTATGANQMPPSDNGASAPTQEAVISERTGEVLYYQNKY